MKKTLMCLALALTPFASQASEANKISYSYAELDYVHKDVPNAATNEPGSNSKGFALRGSLGVGEQFFLTASYGKEKLDNWNSQSRAAFNQANPGRNNTAGLPRAKVNNSIGTWTLGVGHAMPMGGYDWVTQLAYVRESWDIDLKPLVANDPDPALAALANVRFKDSFGGYDASTGVRGRLGDSVIGNAYFGYRDMKSASGSMYADLGLEFQFNESWSWTGKVRLTDGLSELGTGLRWTF